jgi:hypothetical protein
LGNSEPTTVLGLFAEVDPASIALKGLEKRHDWRDLLVLSAFPFPEGVLEADRSKSRLPLITVICALVGIVLGIALAGGTALLYVIHQGGKPVVSGPPTAIIAYEAMMLVALTGVFFRALQEMRLPGWQARVYDPRISEGLIGIAARCGTEEEALEAEEIFRIHGAADIKRDTRRLE